MSKERPSPVRLPDKPIPDDDTPKKKVKFLPVDLMLNEIFSDGERHKAADIYQAIKTFRDDDLMSINNCQAYIVALRKRMKVLEPELLIVTEKLGYVLYYRKCRHLSSS